MTAALTTPITAPTVLPRAHDGEPLVYAPMPGEDPTPGIRAVLADPGPAGLVGVDVETSGLEWDARLRTAQFGTPMTAVVLQVERDPLHAEAARAVLAEPGRWFTAHNAVFDALVLDRNGLVDGVELLARTVDTLILASLNEPPARFEGEQGRDARRDLKSLSEGLLGQAYSPEAKKELQASWRKRQWTVSGPHESRGWAQCDTTEEPFLRYAAADVIDGSRLAETLLPLVGVEVGGTVIEREHRLLALCAQMQRAGYLVDRDAAAERIARETERLTALDAQLADLGVSEPTKNRLVAEALETETGVALPTTAKGEKQVDKLVLTSLTGSRIAPVLLERRAVAKGASTYLSNWMELSEPDGRLHPSINALKAATGRFSMDGPSMQNVPAELRGFITADPGCVLISADFSSVEMRIGAGYAQDENLVADFRNGTDPYRLVARAAYHPHDPDDSAVTKPERQRAKAILLGRMYGRGAGSLAKQEGMDEAEAAAIMSLIDDRYPRLGRFSRELTRRVQYGQTRIPLPSGRAVAVDPTWARKAMNYVVQGTGRDLLVDAGFRLADAGLRQHLWMSIHDEWIVQVPENSAEQVRALMEQVMSTEFCGVPVVAEATVLGAVWGK
ncbi:DNA polymerase [Mycobacteroides abscessus]|uniref:DNA polymerase n=1 Tax=Mycobacteroides abscessus TaxID=36809 RepID=UPI000928C611|nr:DNA polymerase [Mycobacteroides abscessus]SHX64894.1 putative DNA polymerase [Mycobacteroides abscessus subsp. abscessus]SHZ18041.1 DNA polymerase I [Mycobacteroides abscessus subsp. abscessus]SIB51087.1 putative DNA polymerase [Mycobacteroides abscessus subsp. abscessus]SIF18439.1 putative DNA polymerase [Mycobacteroides abscessus subsp. abscessus]SKI48247.1 DNA polymerase I [Mycobacteroides abscessus subsp. abscessus]